MRLRNSAKVSVIRMRVRAKIAKRHIVVGLRFQLARTVLPRRVAIQKHSHHHRRRVRRHAHGIHRFIRSKDRAQIQSRNHIHQKTRQMISGSQSCNEEGTAKTGSHRQEKTLAHNQNRKPRSTFNLKFNRCGIISDTLLEFSTLTSLRRLSESRGSPGGTSA